MYANRQNYDDNDDNDNSVNRETAYGLYQCGKKNCKLCFNCGNQRFLHDVKLYAHRSCFPYEKCYSCRSTKHYGKERVNMCTDCLRKLKDKKGDKYSDYCYICGEKVLFKSNVSYMK